MEVNKEEAERCRDMGAAALKQGNYNRAAKLLTKSLRMYPLPGVEALLGQAERKMNSANGGTNGSSSERTTSSSSSSSFTRNVDRSASNMSAPNMSAATGADGRSYTQDQVDIVKKVLKAKEGGRGAHYRVLGIESQANENQIKKAYRKLALKLHPDKNSAPKADEAFKAVGLAYATLSDQQKRSIYDRYGDEDPDNRGGSSAGAGGMHFRRGEDVNPEDIFNMFFNGMHGGGAGFGGPGFHVYSSGFGPGGVRFHHPGARRARGQQGDQQQPEPPGMGVFLQFLPFLIIMMLSFFNLQGSSHENVYQTRYFSLTQTTPFIHPLQTKYSEVRDIPYFVTEQFMRTYYLEPHLLKKVEGLVEDMYHKFLVNECKSQQQYQLGLKRKARMYTGEARARALKKADEVELTRCSELQDLFPRKPFTSSR